jgi:hypothetical protein
VSFTDKRPRAVATDNSATRVLWDAVAAWPEFPYLYELQHPKTDPDLAHIATTFKPYLDARDWVSIDRGRTIEFTDDGIRRGPDAPRAVP